MEKLVTKEDLIQLIKEIKIKMVEKLKIKYPIVGDSIESPETMGYGTAWFPKLLYDDGKPLLSLISDGEIQGSIELRDGHLIARESIEGAIFGSEGEEVTFEFVKQRIERICLSDNNIDACYDNIAGDGLGYIIASNII